MIDGCLEAFSGVFHSPNVLLLRNDYIIQQYGASGVNMTIDHS